MSTVIELKKKKRGEKEKKKNALTLWAVVPHSL